MNKRPSESNTDFIKAAILKRSLRNQTSSTEEEDTYYTPPPTPYSRDSQLVINNQQYDLLDQSKNSPGTGIDNQRCDDDEGEDDEKEEAFEYLDHTADIQFHSWGIDLSSCLCQLVKCMFGYMTDLNSIEIDEDMSSNVAKGIVAQGHDWKSLVYSFLDEWLFVFHDTGFLVKEMEILSIDRSSFTIISSAKGEKMKLGKHPQGTEIKAITYSNMQIDETESRSDIWVIVDI